MVKTVTGKVEQEAAGTAFAAPPNNYSFSDRPAKAGNPAAGTVKTITSLANPIIKDLRALALKKHRERERLFIAEGLKLVLEGLELGHKIRYLVYAEGNESGNLAEQAAARSFSAGALVIKANAKIMAAITHRDNAQNIIGVFEQQWYGLEQVLQGRAPRAYAESRPAPPGNKNAAKTVWPRLFLALDRVRDPGNLGTIIRTADAAGVSGLVLVGDTASPFALEAVRATMGSIFAVPLCRLSLPQFLQKIHNFAGQIIGTYLHGGADYRMLPYFEDGKDIMLIMGNEQQGLADSLVQACSALARIPQTGRADSLNLAVSTGIMLYEICRNRLTF
ncbi:TrmH family RNA methyltransferase [Candidatus Tokpelaia sp.]|uniref:TrmH family RNA methyltransferase n=1 Tax=Candidatus Tokpelaia sp. TaxID=2233777 RepID=UPI001238F8D0|nr:RNA methyltransferase [Candidatus Tokpelaia sp.]KAA6406106.1 RNA methyltransferase [Candidatus Tokpelaia sp.]